jgi:peptide deformylase
VRLSILQYGDPILRAKGKRIEQVDNGIRELAANMIETMHAANGVGLAAQQIGEAMELTVLDISQVEDRLTTIKLNDKEVDPASVMPLVLVNPQVKLGRETESGTEG